MAVATLVAVAAFGWARDVNSDYYAWQRLLDIWIGQGHGHAWISEDLFPTRFPLYLLLGAFGLESHREVVVAATVLNVAAGAAFATGLLLSGDVARPLRLHTIAVLALPATWATAALGSVVLFDLSDGFLFNPNSRSLELGLAVLAVAWIGRELSTDRLRATHAVVIVGALALLWLSDPFVLYLFGIPAAVVGAIDLISPARRAVGRNVMALVGASGALSWLVRRALGLFDVTAAPVANGRRFVTPVGDVPDRLRLVLDQLVTLLGVSGSDLTSAAAGDLVLAWLRLGLVALGVTGAVLVVRTWHQSSLLARTLVLALVADIAGVTATNIFRDPDAVVGRYLTVALVALIGLAAIAVGRLHGRVGSAAGVLVAALVLAVVVTGARDWWNERDADPVAAHVALNEAVARTGWDRVYGSYFLAIRQDQVGGSNVRWVTVRCGRAGRLRLFHFNNDTAVARGHPATIAVALETSLGCSRADLRRAYGAPDEVVEIDDVRFAVWRKPPERLRALT